MIKNIEISKLKPHPNNPRKTIGDIYEIIQKLGYTPADEELEYINGTHKLYASENSERTN